MKTKRDKYDITFSNVIRERDDYRCQSCQQTGKKMDCSHFFSRRHQATRYDPDNACCHCFSCHQKLGENPIIFTAWIKSYLGDTRYEMLNERHKTIKKWIKGEKDEMRAHYQAALKEMQEQRSQGVEGVLDLVGYE